MRRLFVFHVVIISWLASLAAEGGEVATAPMTMRVDATKTYQHIEHFGASAAWWAQDVGTWPAETRDTMLDLLFDPATGIGLDLVRYNIGGGKLEAKIADPWRSAASPLMSGGSLDWSRDAAAMSVIDGAVARGAKVILFFNSPPASMTQSGRPTGKGAACNLDPDKYDEFARYIARCAKELGKRWPLVAVSPVNEPQWDWQPSKGQEGCHYSPKEAARLVGAVARVFKAERIALPVSVIDSGDWTLAHNKAYLEALLADRDAKGVLDHYAVHSYWSGIEDREDLVAWLAKAKPGLRLWMTEWTEMREGKDLGMDAALTLANTVHEDLVTGGVTSWQYWIAVSRYNYADGLLYADPVRRTFESTKKLWALGNWSRFVEPGAVRVEASVDPEARLRVSAYRNPDGACVLVVLNGDVVDSPAIRLEFTGASGTAGVAGAVSLWETSAARDLEKVEPRPDGSIVFPASSVTTVVVR